MKRWRPTRPRLLICLLLLVAAVLATVLTTWAVSWGAGVRGGSVSDARDVLHDDWVRPVSETWPAKPTSSRKRGRFGVRVLDQAALDTESMRLYQITWIDAGWPFLAARYTAATELDMQTGEAKLLGSPLSRGIRITDPPGATFLPLTVLPLGFLANTVIYGSALLAIVVVVQALRRAVRRRRGRCPACGYDGAGLEQCPECGATL